jgi:Undecaprenyl-phosphate glucose phosphotransferase
MTFQPKSFKDNMSVKIATSTEFAPTKENVSLSPSIITGLVFGIDFFVLILCGVITFLYYPGWNIDRFPLYLTATVSNAVIIVIGFNFAGLYKIDSILYPSRQFTKLFFLSLLALLVLVNLGFALKISTSFSRVWVFCLFCSTLIFAYLSRLSTRKLLLHWVSEGRLIRNIAIVGAGEQGARLIDVIKKRQDSWVRIVGLFDDRSSRIPQQVSGHIISGDVNTLVATAQTQRIDDVLVALPWGAEKRVFSILGKLQVLPVDVRLSPDLVGLSFTNHEYSYYCGVPTLNVYDKPISDWDYVLKTIEDLVVSIAILIFISPLMLLIALLIKIDSPGPVLFRQKRYGFYNQLIEVYKFRTMYIDKQDNNASQLTKRNDPRVTKLGRFLRRTSLDELPQFFNVLKGDMSVVGPRPHATEAKAAGVLYQELINNYAIRHKVKPGITGWAQVSGWRGETDTEEKICKRVEHDIEYIDNWSILLDLKIILATVWVSLKGNNAY